MLVLKQINNLLPATPVLRRDWHHLKNLDLADPTYWKPGPIHILLGADVYARIVQEGIRRGKDTEPIALNTTFGWIVLGNTPVSPTTQTAAFNITVNSTDDLNFQLKSFWETEEILETPIFKPEDIECQEIYERTHQRLSNGQYQVRLPFVNNKAPELGESRKFALQRLSSLQRKFIGNPQLEEDYSKCLNEYIELGHMERISTPAIGEPNYYIPHHAVFKESTTTKLRVVFDASARSSNGHSLNQQLLIGPTLQPKLFATLLKWRKYKVAMTADIEKMYRMILIHPDHRTYQRILWQDPKTKEVQDFQLNTVTFGTSCAPYLAIRTLQQLSKDSEKIWPMAAKATLTDFYVDDLLSGADSANEAKELRDQFINMLNSGGFTLRKWASNHNELLSDIPAEHREIMNSLEFSEHESIKTVGIRWHPSLDYFFFKITLPQKPTLSTKRTILSAIASLYDPLGWISPVIVVAKILIQALWIAGSNWDAKVPDIIEQQWLTFTKELPDLERLQIPRWVGWTSSNCSIQLHGFSDASIKAYAAVLYLRVEDKDGNVTSTMLTSKTKVAPIKPITLPRLELNGALILSRLITSTIKDMQLENVPIFAWTDSMIALQWIKGHPIRWKTYVANRVVEIQEATPPECWHHVPTSQNPADLASRGSTAANLVKNTLWWHGPEWLVKPPSNWPRNTIPEEPTELEAKKQFSFTCLTTHDNEFLTRYSCFTKLIRITALILRFIYNCRNRTTKRIHWLSSLELQTARNTILKVVQQVAFPHDYSQLQRKQELSRKSRLVTLNPYLADNGLILVGGRLENSRIPYSRKHPIILPRDHHVTTLIVDKIHKDTLHGGATLMLNTSRNEYWILDAKRLITQRIHQCIVCTAHRKATRNQLMGHLPAPRVNITKPFTHVGLDYAGPVSLRTSPHRCAKTYKGYICIFVCMATKAMHIELASDLTASAFIAAVKRFVARRGLCTDIYSDCGTNFVGGKNVLDKEVAQAIKQATVEIGRTLATQNISWHFNPPASPHFGGLWEAGVKSVKHHLRRTLGNTLCTYEELTTLLTQIEACLNSRPLCPISNDVDDLDVLTPGHFLIGQPLNAIPEPNLIQTKVLPAQRWKYMQLLTQQFWDKWKKEYLHRLQQRPKWLKQQPNIKVNDVVLLKDETTPPTHWPLGIIEEVYPGKDNLIRVVKVRTKHGSFKRPVVKLCQLPVETAAEFPTQQEDIEKKT